MVLHEGEAMSEAPGATYCWEGGDDLVPQNSYWRGVEPKSHSLAAEGGDAGFLLVVGEFNMKRPSAGPRAIIFDAWWARLQGHPILHQTQAVYVTWQCWRAA